MMEIRRSVKEKITRIQRTKNGISKREFVRKIKKMKPFIISEDEESPNRISSADLSLYEEANFRSMCPRICQKLQSYFFKKYQISL